MADAFPTSAPSPVLPFDRSYWVLPGRLLAGYVPVKPDPAGTRQQLRGLLAQVDAHDGLQRAMQRNVQGSTHSATQGIAQGDVHEIGRAHV